MKVVLHELPLDFVVNYLKRSFDLPLFARFLRAGEGLIFHKIVVRPTWRSSRWLSQRLSGCRFELLEDLIFLFLIDDLGLWLVWFAASLEVRGDLRWEFARVGFLIRWSIVAAAIIIAVICWGRIWSRYLYRSVFWLTLYLLNQAIKLSCRP